ncbi:hypothetical protein NCAS_0B04870 [Naumovozyma castellii]|uniref:RNA helicase n=1 Tax=Naumovozyma castellii TaxID=27288 RepID=G0V9F5_NAUCA|nr:hypothetical protein NCAS_0B04870 [Naumovozyma castellii CBS 4309]CCC68571.1 hypothetical protein NCAS_0B04870 [Naumovozyma castellii CBS 4309]
MGVGLRRDIPDEEKELAKKAVNATLEKQEQRRIKKEKLNLRTSAEHISILDSESISQLAYQPSDKDNMAVYEEILEWVTNLFGNDIPHDIIVNTADILIQSIKEDELESDGFIEKRRESIEKDLGVIIEKSKFIALIKMIQNISDYHGTESNIDDSKAVTILANEDSDEDSAPQDEEMLLDEDEDEDEIPDDVEESEIPTKSQFTDINFFTNKEELLILNGNNDIGEKRKISDLPEETIGSEERKKLKIEEGEWRKEIINLDTLNFDQGSKLMTVTKVSLPEGSFKRVKPHYEEIHIPAPSKPTLDYDLIPISAFPKWTQNAFPSNETETLNAIQSKVFPAAFENDYNLLLCAPTGAGKTNVAILTILRSLSSFYNPNTKKLAIDKFKAVFIAPLKALVQEQVRELQRRLSYLGIKVAELTGDSRLTRQQINETHILVSTPEKWDVVTRKSEDTSFIQFVRLIIIDEIHLLHDERGPVIEAIVARTLWSNHLQTSPRIIGISATLPNYRDVGRFLRAPKEGIFYFDASFRPCPLTQQFCGITEQNSLKRLSAMNEACYDKVLETVSEGHQVIVFVHSRKETARTATWLKDRLHETDNIDKLRKSDAGSKEILKTESENIQDPNLKKLLTSGISIHHAGLSRNDRSLSEDLFADGLIQVLVSTATLAWGVNLPAHTVIIKGTEIYSPEKGTWQQLSPQDILQMLGRAGRPRYDTHGEGVIITNQTDVQYYLAVLNQQLPIESQFVSRLVDNLNAEVVSGSVRDIHNAVTWLSYTYLYIRMLESPILYKVEEYEKDTSLVNFREKIIHSALTILSSENLIVYDPISGAVEPTELGRIASYFYIKHSSIDEYNRDLSEHTSLIDVFRIFSMSDEFKYVSIRQEEKRELKELLERAPIPIKEEVEDPLGKINVLLQSYISKLKFEGFALNSDMIFIQQNAGRLLRAMYELCLKRGWSRSTKMLLNLCKSVDKRIWYTSSPLRQFSSCPMEVIKRAEASTLPWHDYLAFKTPAEVGRSIRSEKYGKLVYDLLRRFPQINLRCSIQPITPSLIRFDLELLPDWIWDRKIHGRGESFIIMLEDLDGNEMLYSDSVVITPELIGEEIMLDFSLQLTAAQQKKLPPNLYISVISENWMHCGNQIPVILETIHLPKKFPAPTQLLDVPLIPTSHLENDAFSSLFSFSSFNAIQSNVFDQIYNTDDNVLVSSVKGTGKTTLAEVALLNHWRQNKGRALYICPSQDQINKLSTNWSQKFSELGEGKVINKLGFDLTINLRAIAQSHVVLATPEQFNIVSRKWRQRKNIHRIELVIFDDLHEISHGTEGAVYEAIISRLLFMSAQLETSLRIIALSAPLANARDMSEWLGVNKINIFNFSPEVRNYPLEVHLQSFHGAEKTSFTTPMLKLAYETAFKRRFNDPSSIIYISSVEVLRSATEQIISLSNIDDWDMLNMSEGELSKYVEKISETRIKSLLLHGIGVIYEEMNVKDKKIIETLYAHGVLSFLLVTRQCYSCCPKSDLVTILGTQIFDGRSHRYVQYPVSELLEMVGSIKPKSKSTTAKVLILTDNNKKIYYKKFLSESMPTESFEYFYLHDLFLNEIGNKVLRNKQDCIDLITYSYFYRRIHANPSYYGVKDLSSVGISAYLTEIVENVVKDLVTSSFIEETETNEKDEVLTPLNGCLIASHNDISYHTLYLFSESLSSSSTLQDMLELLADATEFENIPIRRNDFNILMKLSSRLPLKFNGAKQDNSTSFKVFTLLQCYFSRTPIPIELKPDLQAVLRKAVRLVNAIIDILSGNGYLNATTAMDISQMLIQAVWDVDNPLRQIPHFDEDILEKCAKKKIETVYDIMALEDDEREEIMTMANEKLLDVAAFVNNYPNIALNYQIDTSESIHTGEMKKVNVQLTRDDEPESLTVESQEYPFEKLENWWLVLGEISTKDLLAIRKVSLSKETQTFELDFSIENPGQHNLTIWCVCDSYLDADKEVSFDIEVK